MKKQLLLIIVPILFFSLSIHAQKTWDLGNDGGGYFPVNDGIPSGGSGVLLDNLAAYPHSDSENLMGEIEDAPVDDSKFSDGFTAANRYKLNGGGAATGNMPTVRYLKFAVKGDCDVKIWCRSGGSSERSLLVTDGTNVLGQYDAPLNDKDYVILSASYTGGIGNIYIYGTNNFSLYKIEASANVGETTLSINKKAFQVSTNLKAIGNRIEVSNVKYATSINIYSLTGALVQTVETSSDTSFTFRPGLYIATVKTVEGQKSVKLLLR
ncbi:T9SS type A sorting domain-containing protein [Formosa haliotis]|uniref:T9SS type A sorting domain-containing protein n=1 Tax=Formosa haliotis TaxID=1555194 RepID=UPI00082609BC|nr:T9SS type A sorting domain-containing protein [Formosa haliotis]